MIEQSSRMSELARYIEQHAERKLTLDELAARAGMSPASLQRSFSEIVGVSPMEYQRAARMKGLKRRLAESDDISGAVFEAGFGSVSRVYETLDWSFGMTPAAYRRRGRGEDIRFAVRTTALGPLIMAATARGVCHVHFGESTPTLEAGLREEFPEATVTRSRAERDPELDGWMRALATHIDTGGPRPDLALHVFGTALQIRTWRFLTALGESELRSYSDVAEAIGRPRAARAVANACAANNIALLIPCHRVLRKDGGAGGYRWGTGRKQALLARPGEAGQRREAPG